jgi:HK97 family phage major capsid protein
MGQTDQMIARYMAEIEERQQFVDGIFQAADGKDLSDDQLGLVTDTKKRMEEVNAKLDPLMEMRRISGDSAERVAELAKYMSAQKNGPPKEVEYRSEYAAGEYAIDMWKAALGHEESREKIQIFNRAAAHQTTADSTGLVPSPILGPVVNYVDSGRPLVSALGPRQLPSGNWSRPKVTQHTSVTAQSAEKAELASQKMIISKLAVTPVTYGGYLNVSRQLVDWSDPQAMQIIIDDLAGQYAIKTEDVAADFFVAGGTAATVNLATGANTAEQVAAAFWGAAGQAYAGVKGQGRLIAAAAPQMLGLIGPLFAPINPVSAQSTGFTAANFGQGAVGSIAGIPIYVTAGMADNKMVVMSTAAAEVYEDRIGSLQVVEPSVLGIQVAYAGHFVPLVLEATGIIVITKTP